MEPQLPSPRPSSEMGPVGPRGKESLTPIKSGEQVAKSAPEKEPAKGESREHLPPPSGGDPAAPMAPPLPPITPTATDDDQVSSVATAGDDDDNPLVASDEDLIEKEWVDKAKKIVSETKTDPYMQEKEVSKLQADYLKKRYGKEVKIPDS